MNNPRESLETFQLAYWLRHPDHWPRVMSKIEDVRDKAIVDGLIEAIYRQSPAKAVQAAIDALEQCTQSVIIDALHHALRSPHVYVRLAAIRSLQNRQAFALAPVVSRLLDRDSSWLVRRAALAFVSECEFLDRWQILKAANDPHWRVRHALIQVLLQWTQTGIGWEDITRRLLDGRNDARTTGVVRYLEFRWLGQSPESFLTEGEDPNTWCEFWDWDPAVLAWRFEQMSSTERRDLITIMPRLVGHDDERIRRFAAVSLRQHGQVEELLETLSWLDDPRREAYQTVDDLMRNLDWERAELLVQSVFKRERATPGQWVWALGQIESSVAVEDVPLFSKACQRALVEVPRVRAALARALSRLHNPEWDTLLNALLQDADPDVVLAALEGMAEHAEKESLSVVSGLDRERFLSSNDPEIRAAAATVLLMQPNAMDLLPRLASDSCSLVRVQAAKWLVHQDDSSTSIWRERLERDESPLVRAAALTGLRAKEIVNNPTNETSWRVLEEAARLSKTPLWKFAPEVFPGGHPMTEAKPVMFSLPKPANVAQRTLGTWQVSRLGISGHYGLPSEGFVQAIEAGVNLMFWEPNYHTMTTFMGRIHAKDRNEICMVAGTFAADPLRIQRDVERVLDKLGIEQVSVFLLFWTRSWNRITDAVRDMLDELRALGKIGTCGLSTHSRPLAVEAIETGWNPVMVRHSAAHRGAESVIFPKAQERGMSLLTFNNTCYGRLLESFPPECGLSPADCYRYTMSFDAVTACWSAPATIAELESNLEALHSPEIPTDRREMLLEAGRRVYREDFAFRQLVRGV